MQTAEVRHEASCYVGGLDEKVTESILWELFIQAGPVLSVYLPKDRLTNQHQGFSFVEMQTEEDADYAIKILNMIKLYNRPIRVNKASAHQKDIDIGANLFIGNLDENLDEKSLYDVFSAFGQILAPPRIMRDSQTSKSKGYAFVNFATFEASDAALEAMNGQFLENKPIHIQYAFKKDSKGERHGSMAERLLASKNPFIGAAATTQPNQFFTDTAIISSNTNNFENTNSHQAFNAFNNNMINNNEIMNQNPNYAFGLNQSLMMPPIAAAPPPPNAAINSNLSATTIPLPPPPPQNFENFQFQQQQSSSTTIMPGGMMPFMPQNANQMPVYLPIMPNVNNASIPLEMPMPPNLDQNFQQNTSPPPPPPTN